MIYRKDNYFDKFKCIAGNCPESCCIGWQIMIDDTSILKYKENNDIASGIDFNEECFKQFNGRCSMLDENNLCIIHGTYGKNMLCKTCDEYPRHTEEFENEREYSLSLSCPKVVFDLLSSNEDITLTEWEDDTPDDFDEFDYMLYSRLVDARDVIFNIIKDDSLTLNDKMISILELSSKLNTFLEDGLFAEMDEYISDFKPVTGNYQDYNESKNNFSILFSLETLHEDWNDILEHTWSVMFDKSNPTTLWNEHLNLSLDMEKMCSKLLYSLIYTYFLGAVYDDLIYAKAALCVNSIRYILLITKSYSNNYDFDTFVRIVYTYAREIEHSDVNLDTLDEAFM